LTLYWDRHLDEMIFFEQIVGIEGEPGYALLARS
jgi:hypothetical protein